MSFIVTGRSIPVNCFVCPLDKGVWKAEQDPFIICRYTKEKVRYDDVPSDRRLPCCGLKELPDKHGRLIDGDELAAGCDAPYWCRWLSEIDDMPTIVEAEG